MKSTPLRTTVVAGTCAVALSFVAMPAHAAVPFDRSSGSSATSTTDDSTTDGPSATDISGSDDSSASDDDSSVSDDDGTESDDDGTADDDSSDDSDASGSTTAPLPAETGTPKQDFRSTVLLPGEIAAKGIKVVYSGLTPKAHYQQFFSGGQSGGELGSVRKASGKGEITFVYHPRKDMAWMTELGATFDIGLLGVDTDLRLVQQIEVKYDSDVALRTDRHGKKVALEVSVERSGRSGDDSAWKKAEVDLQKKVGTRWVTVRTVRTNAAGVARATVRSGKSLWRAVVHSGGHVAGATTKGHRR